MSRQGEPRIKIPPKVSPRSSPGLGPAAQGPMRATLPLSVVFKDDTGIRQDFWKGRRSPGARIYTKSDKPQPTAPIRRSSSLDTMYRFWGRSFPIDGIFPCKNRATQTENRSESLTDEIRRMFTTNRTQSLSPNLKSGATHGSEEGLNREIESYTGRLSYLTLGEPIPEGRKAPILDLLREPSDTDFSPNQVASDESGDGDSDQEIEFRKQKINFSASLPQDSCGTSKDTRTLTVPIKLTPSAFFKLQPSSVDSVQEKEPDIASKTPEVPQE